MNEEKLKVKRYAGCYWNQKPDYVRPPMWDLSRCLKADGGHPAGILIEYD